MHHELSRHLVESTQTQKRICFNELDLYIDCQNYCSVDFQKDFKYCSLLIKNDKQKNF